MRLSRTSIRNWSWSDRNQLKQDIKLEVAQSNTFLSNSGYIRLSKYKNWRLFALLSLFGFFDYHVTNNGFTCYYHQIIAYISSGYRKYIKGEFCLKGELEVHHFDKNKFNNSPENLTYVTPEENKLFEYFVQFKPKMKDLLGLPQRLINIIVKTNKACNNPI